MAESRKGTCYAHEMDTAHHQRLADACHAAVDRGARVAISGYASTLYDELYAGWRTMTFDVSLKGTRHSSGARRTEVLWCSYPETEAIGYVAPKPQLTLFGDPK